MATIGPINNNQLLSTTSNTAFANLVVGGGTVIGSDNLSIVTSGLAVLGVHNTSGASIAVIYAETAAATDAYFQVNTSSTARWVFGADASDSNAFVVGDGATVGSNNRLKITTAGIVTVPNAINVGPGTPLSIGSNSFPLQASASNSGNSVAIGINNNSNTANSHAQVTITVGGTSGGDPQIILQGGTNPWSFGSDTSATDLFTIASGYVLGTTNRLTITPAGIVTVPNALNAGSGTMIVPGSNSAPLQASQSNSGNAVFVPISNTSNTANSHAQLLLAVGGTSGGDPKIVMQGGATSWGLGSDTSATNLFTICTGGNLGSNNVLTATTAGEVSMPLQPAFLAYLATSDLDVTGNGATYTLGSGNALTEVFDQNSDFNTNGTFTAPVGGRYNLAAGLQIEQLTSAMTFGSSIIVTSNREMPFFACNYAAIRGVTLAPDLIIVSSSGFFDMDAADTAVVKLIIFGGVGDTADVGSSADARTHFAGYLAC